MSMKMNTKATNIVLSESVTDYLNKKIEDVKRLLDLSDETLFMQVDLGRTTRHHHSGEIFRAEINIFSSRGQFRAVTERQDLFSAIDGVKEEIMTEIARRKGRRLSLLKRGGQKIKAMLRGLYRKK